MSIATHLRRTWFAFLTAIQFLTCIPVPSQAYEVDSLARATMFFPLVGLLVGSAAALLHLRIASHFSRPVGALVVVLFTVLVTGGLHEDGLADAADGLGGGSSREKILLILRDSRIGSYGGLALIFSIVSRMILIASLPLALVPQYLITAHVLCRWTPLPLSYLPAARAGTDDGQGVRITRRLSPAAIIAATSFSFVVAAALLGRRSVAPLLGVAVIAWLSGVYYKRRIGGVTGDCFGATIQLAEIGVYLCGAWNA